MYFVYIISPQCQDTSGWNTSSCETQTRLFYIVNIIAADDLATQGAKSSATIIDLLI